MILPETSDDAVSIQHNKYTITDDKDQYLLKTIHIPKKDQFNYAFIGGMWYSTTSFSLDSSDISLPYPFTTYYTLKILDKHADDIILRSALYVKTPMFIIQFPTICYLVEFDPYVLVNNQEVFIFIGLKETEESYDISFYLCKDFTIKQKKYAWLGRGEKKETHLNVNKNDWFHFSTKTSSFSSWKDAVVTVLNKNLRSIRNQSQNHDPKQVFAQAKDALWRSYDSKRGTFLQLPWRKTPGFTFVGSSYSLLTYEAVRLYYFSKWYEHTGDEDFALWMKQLHELFLLPSLHTTPRKRGEGIIWYNMTTLTKKGLAGYFYMDTGYSGYPGGQATIDLFLTKYLLMHPDKNLKHLVKQSLRYILSTQNKDGSWPMAIRQQGVLRFRPEKLDKYTSWGGTAEAACALLHGAQLFQDPEMRDAAKKALDFLVNKYPICYNGLRDIGVMEPEAFSAVSVINAFLDGYTMLNEDTYLDQAKTYAYYTVPWMYQWNTKELPFQFNFHPISFSITPRLSPYETAWIVSTYHRLAKYTNESFWKTLNQALFNHVTSWISETGGLSEGVFPNGFKGCSRLPMEQTFATVELMKSAEIFINQKKKDQKETKPANRSHTDSYMIEQTGSMLYLKDNGNIIFSFDASKATITELSDVLLNPCGITFSFFGSQKKKVRRNIIQNIRGNYGKYLLGAKDATYAITGVKGPNPDHEIHIEPVSNDVTSYEIIIESETKAIVTCETAYHTIKIQFDFSIEKQSIRILMDICIHVKKHDLPINQQIMFPLIGAVPIKSSDERIDFEGFSLSGDLSNRVQTDSYTAINQTLVSNWTHAGVCKKQFVLTIPLRK